MAMVQFGGDLIMKKWLYFMTVLLILIVFAACDGDDNTQNLAPIPEQQETLYIQGEESYDNADIYNDLEASHYTNNTYFERIDLDRINFSDMVFPAETPHGHIGHWYVSHISTYLPSRVAFTYRELDAALWLKEMLYAKGFDEYQVGLQTFSYEDISDFEDFWETRFGWEIPGLYDIQQMGWTDGHEIRNYSQNVIVTMPGQSTQTIIIGAHYDSLRYPGASDNASGTALLMESAQRMLANDNYYTLVFVFFGAHEIGMFGGLYFYNSLTIEERENIVLFIQADVLIEGPYLAFSAGYNLQLNPNAVSSQIDTIAQSIYEAYEINISHHPIFGSEQQLFLYKGHTVLAFWGVDPSYFTNFLHTERDCYEYISAKFPGMIERNMSAFALFLETILLEGNLEPV